MNRCLEVRKQRLRDLVKRESKPVKKEVSEPIAAINTALAVQTAI